MEKKTQGIVLKQIKYSESSLIVKIYTLDYGIQSYLVKGIRNKKNKKNSLALFQPLSHIELTSFTYKKSDLNIFKEGKVLSFYKEIHSDPIKITIVFFLSDLLSAILKEESPDLELFSFISESLQVLDEETQYANFHLWFILHLTKFLGFFPNTDIKTRKYFNLLEGNFNTESTVHTCSLEDSFLISRILNLNIEEVLALKLTQLKRQNLLDILIKYYNLQNYTISNIKSLKIIQEILETL